MKHLLPVLLCLPAAVFLYVEPAEMQTVRISTMTAQMKYDDTEFTVRPGQPIEIVFQNGDDLPHNLVFCKPGTNVVEMSMKQMDQPELALKRNWLPEDPRILAHSRMLNPKEREVIRFTAPEKPGVYPYVCTFPGHAMTMNGEMKVTPEGEGLRDLKFKMYLGDWKQLPDFSKLKEVHREGVVEDNLIQVKLDDYKNQFGVVYTAKIVAPRTGSYRFFLTSDDGARILIDGKKVVEYDGIHPAGSVKSAGVKLDQGEHEFRLEYFQAGGGIEIYAAWKGTDFDITPLSTWRPKGWQEGDAKKKPDTLGMPIVVGKEPVIYRNFIAGAGNRGIAVGYPGGINIAWSAESMNLALVWRGAFMDSARHWNSRGGGYLAPLGYDVLRPTGEVTPALAATNGSSGPSWPTWNKEQRYEGYIWKGYTLDETRNPTFRYEWNGVAVEDTFAVSGTGTGPDAKLIRTIRLKGSIPAGALFRIAAGKMLAKDGAYQVDGAKFTLDGNTFGNQFILSAKGAEAMGENLVVPATPEIVVTYAWPR